MKKNLKIISVLTVLMLAFLISPLQVSAAQPIAKEYTVTYRPGNIARFSDALVQKYQEYYGEENVSVSQATGSISITVQAGSFYPEAPSAEDIVMDEEHKDRYYVTTNWIPTEETVMQDQDYVVDYAALIDAVEYSIRYVDAYTGMDVLSPTILQGNVGDTITSTAKVITNYQWDTYLKEMVLEKDSENILTFYYTDVKPPEYETIYLEGETIYNVITIPGRVVSGDSGQEGNAQGGRVAGDQENSEGNSGTGEEGGLETGEEGSQEIGENENTGNQGNEQGESEENLPAIDEEIIIDEEQVPLASFWEENRLTAGLIAVGILSLAALSLITLSQMKKKKEIDE